LFLVINKDDLKEFATNIQMDEFIKRRKSADITKKHVVNVKK